MIFDLHNDMPTSKLSDEQKNKIVSESSDTAIYAFWTTELVDPIGFIYRNIRNTFKNTLFSIEDIGFISGTDLNVICELKPAYCGLTHNLDNALAGGAVESGGLTKLGSYTVRRLNGADVAIDAAHLNRRSFYDVIDIAERIIDSHTGIESFCTHPRNLTDEQIKLILARGGIIGITAVKDFIGCSTACGYAEIIDRYVQKFGIDGACIGTDFYGTEPLENLNGYKDFEGIAEFLGKFGYTQTEIHRIFYDNANNYFKYRRT